MSDQILPRYLYIPMEIEWNQNLQNLDGKVYGVIYWYSKMSKKKCTASNRQIADAITGPSDKAKKVNPTSVANSIGRLAKEGYLKVILERSQRVEIVPLLTETADQITTPSSTDEGYEVETVPPSSINEPPKHVELNTHHLQMKGTSPELNDPSSIDDTSLHQMMNPPSSTDEQKNNINTEDSNNIYISNVESEKPKVNRASKRDIGIEDALIQQFLDYYNLVCGTHYSNINSIRANFKYWSSIYDFEAMKKAIDNIAQHKFWKEAATPEKILRRKNQNREDVDYIGELCNLRTNNISGSNKSRTNFTEERLAEETQRKETAYGQIVPAF